MHSVIGKLHHDPATLGATQLIDALATMARQIAATVEQSCLSVCRDFNIVNAALIGNSAALEEASASCMRVMKEMQFQDRHKQATQDMEVLLGALRGFDHNHSRVNLEALCGRLQLRETRDMLRTMAGAETAAPPAPDTIELF